ncbi:MAG: gluconokinase [Anaerolineae bacterium]|nr:gluconokinase [Anaerolineae bacterium]
MDSSHPLIIAVDIGTGSSRALLIDSRLHILASFSAPCELIEPASGHVEQAADQVLLATLQVIRQAALTAAQQANAISGICFSSAVSSLLAVNEAGLPLCHALTWADTRAQPQVKNLKEKALQLYQRTGTPQHASYWLPKLIWMRQNRPEIFLKTRYWVGLKDYVVHYLTGEYLTDTCNAAATGMLNSDTLTWDEFSCDLAGISTGQLPALSETTSLISGLRADVAAELELPPATPLILGAGDGMLANLGSGVITPGQVATTIGSSGACRSASTHPVLDDALMRAWSYPLLKDLWIIGGAENSGGLIVNWFTENYWPAGPHRFDDMLQAVSKIPPGSQGLIFLPYLLGERAPIWDENARGAFIGLDSRHSPAHLARAVLEGVIFALYDVYRSLGEYTAEAQEIRVSGGYTRSPVWLSIQANLFNKKLVVLKNHECSALGAAILGFYALGVFPDLKSGCDLIEIKETIHPDPRQQTIYEKIIPLYTQAYHQLKPIFEVLKDQRETGEEYTRKE